MRTAVFGVGDLCVNWCEARDLVELITSQSSSANWVQTIGTGGTVLAPRHDVLVVRNTDRVLRDVRKSLDEYREALTENPPPEVDYDEIETRYYTVTAEEAADLLVTIPELIEPGTWKRVTNPEAPRIETLAEHGVGSLLRVSQEPFVRTLDAPAVDVSDNEESDDDKAPQVAERTLVTPQATLIVRHTKLTQLRVAEFIGRLSQFNHGTNDAGQSLQRGPDGGGFFHVGPEEASRN
jgi:hypothetical protein